jgi:hypothetical protein
MVPRFHSAVYLGDFHQRVSFMHRLKKQSASIARFGLGRRSQPQEYGSCRFVLAAVTVSTVTGFTGGFFEHMH